MAENWSDDELTAAVEAYREMYGLEAAGKSYSKLDFYRALASRFGRTGKAFEYRMQNISAVLHEQGRSWIPGLKPAGNVGANVKPRVIALIQCWEDDKLLRTEKAVSYKKKLPAIRDWLIEVARHRDQVTYGLVMEAFGVDRFSLRHGMDFLGHQVDNLSEPILTALIVGKKTRNVLLVLPKSLTLMTMKLNASACTISGASIRSLLRSR